MIPVCAHMHTWIHAHYVCLYMWTCIHVFIMPTVCQEVRWTLCETFYHFL